MPSLKDVQGLPEDLPRELGLRLTMHEDERRALERQEKLTAKWWAERSFEQLPPLMHGAQLATRLEEIAVRIYAKAFASQP